MKIFLGADHRGYNLKEKIKSWFEKRQIEFVDEGAKKFDPDDDYTTFASKVALSVSKNKDSKGIIFCGSGVGVEITANKFDGAYASIGKNALQVEAGRKDDNFNILVIAADFTSDSEAKEMIDAFINTEYENVERHDRRLQEIKKIESIN